MPSPANRLVIALAQIPSIVGDIAGNRDRVRKARAEAAAFGADLMLTPELYLSGYPPEDLVLKPAFQEACRTACEELARETADGGPAVLLGLPWVEDGKLHNAMALLTAGPDRGGAVQGRPAELRRLRREARVRPRPLARPDRLSRRAHRRADLRGHLGAGPGRMHPRDRRRDPARRQRLALRARQARDPRERRGRRAWSRAACRSSISTWSAGRTSSCSRAPPSRSTPTAASPCSCPPSAPWSRAPCGSGARRAGAASRARARRSRRATRPTMRPA